MTNIRIMLIEDNQDDVELLKEMFLEMKCSLSGFVHVDRPSTALELLEKERFDIVLLDMSLLDSFGSGTFYRLRDKMPETPIIVITGNKDEALIDILLQNGAQDCLIKGSMDPGLLMHSINYALERQRLLTSLNHKTQQLQSLKESLEYIISNNADAIIIVDLQGIIRFANQAAAGILNCRQEEIIGKDFGFPVLINRTMEINIVRGDGLAIVAEMRVVEINWKNKPAYLAAVRDTTERKKMETEIMQTDFYDKLTGLYNRAFFNEELKRLDTERNLPVCLIIGDVNNFKLINDALGHAEGDRLLVDIARIFKRSCRKEDIVIRLAGDEFAILLPKCNERDAKRIKDNIKEACKNLTHYSIPVSIALGIAVKHEHGQSASDVFELADNRMYTNKLVESKSTRSSVITMLEKAMYEKDYLTEEHTVRVRELSIQFAIHLGLNDSIIDELAILASLHDIGKIAVPEHILKKEGPLNDEEWEIIKKHPQTGYQIANVTHGISHIAEDILFHHERWDGKGYPQKLKEKQIPFASRLLSIIDAFDVMIHDRPYKKAMSEKDAVNEIIICSCSQFDPELSNAFVNYLGCLGTI